MPASMRNSTALYQALGAQQSTADADLRDAGRQPRSARGIDQGPRPAQFDDRLQMRAVKALIDGALGSRGAAMLRTTAISRVIADW